MTTKNRTKEEKSISSIVLLGSTITIILVSLILAFILIRQQIKEFKTHLDTFERTIIQRERFTIRSAVQNLKEDILYEQKAQYNRIKQIVKERAVIANNIAEYIYKNDLKKDKKLVLKKIKKAIQNIYLKNDGIDYYIFNKNGVCLLNTRDKRYEGKNFLGFEDLNGKKFIKNIINNSKKRAIFDDFVWYIPKKSRIGKKITYSIYFKKLDIVIGAGKYLQDGKEVEKYLEDKLKKIKLSRDKFLFLYKIGSLSDIEKDSTLLIEKNIKTDGKILEAVKSIMEKSRYSGDIFFQKDNMLIYSSFLETQRLFLAFGINLKYIVEIIESETAIANKNLQYKIISLVLTILIIIVLFFILSYFVAKKIETIFKRYRLKVIDTERKYQLLFNHSNDGFIISKILSEDRAIIISTNSVAKKISGYGLELIGMNFFTLFVNLDKKMIFQNGEILDSVIMKTKDKTKRNIELSSVLFDYGKERLLFSSLRDISERVALKREKDIQEKLLIQRSKMAAMGEMIGNIAHQWRQPISELSGLFFDIESAYEYGELDKEYLSKRTDEANDLLEYMSKTIDDFKEFYNPKSKKRVFSIKESLDKTVAIIRSSFKYHNIEIEIAVDSTVSVLGYSNEFSQVLLNILSNSKEAALIRDIKEPKVKIYTSVEDGSVYLNIEDNCGGIEQDILDKIFEPYFTTKYNYGTGIGLYMSKIIIENKMEGKIAVQNIDKKGVRFIITLNRVENERVD